MTMLNLSNVIHTYVYGAPNEHVASTATLVVGLCTNASICIEGLLLGCNNYKKNTIKYLYKFTKYKINI
jgi:hypothetical protein